VTNVRNDNVFVVEWEEVVMNHVSVTCLTSALRDWEKPQKTQVWIRISALLARIQEKYSLTASQVLPYW
jgi:hypothetical protein